MPEPLLLRITIRQPQRLHGQIVVVIHDSLDNAVESEQRRIPKSDVRKGRGSEEREKNDAENEHLEGDGRWRGEENGREGEERRSEMASKGKRDQDGLQRDVVRKGAR